MDSVSQPSLNSPPLPPSDDEKTTYRKRCTHLLDHARQKQLCFYANDFPIWKRVLEEAKLSFQAFLTTENAWPTWTMASREVREIINEVVKLFKLENRPPEDSK
jgi:hypothetical protein